jgi:signal peptidase I
MTVKILRDYGITVVVAIAVALSIRSYLIEAYRVPSQSEAAMKPTLEPGETVFVAKAPYGVKLFGHETFPPSRGEVILYSPPEDPTRDYIKRVIGLPGDTIRVHGGQLEINEKVLPIEFGLKSTCGTEILPTGPTGLKHGVCIEPPVAQDFGPEKVPADKVFVLGDLRNGPQMDSEERNVSWGLIPFSALKGKVLWVWLSLESPQGVSSGAPKLRFERMFRRVN